ncbi:MAG: DUF1223 domain-containing protein [Pseudomonadota bacterium]
MRLIGLFIFAVWNCAVAGAQELQLQSGVDKNYVVELYTSEGCNSCPPADRWISSLTQSKQLWHDIIPAAFHVTYWDYLGWRDRFARREFDSRQRRMAKLAGASVYTPGVFLSGAQWRAWRRLLDGRVDLPRIEVGELIVGISNDVLNVSFNPVDDLGDLILEIVWMDRAAETDVQAGENAGRKLQHNFVVREVVSQPMQKTSHDWTLSLMVPAHMAGHDAIGVWVRNRSGEIIQATGGWLGRG